MTKFHKELIDCLSGKDFRLVSIRPCSANEREELWRFNHNLERNIIESISIFFISKDDNNLCKLFKTFKYDQDNQNDEDDQMIYTSDENIKIVIKSYRYDFYGEIL